MPLLSIRLTLVLLFCLIKPASLWAASMPGQVLSVTSGNRISLSLNTGERREIRLVGIIPPERTTMANNARRHLHMLLAGKFVMVDYQTISPRGEIIGQVLHGGIDINLRMLQDGMARLGTVQHLNPHLLTEYETAQRHARERRLGVWKNVLH